jgi:hypothetical protein
MPYARKYESYEVRALLQGAEGNASPVTNAPAHSRSLHAQSLHGGEGITKTALEKRVDTTGLAKKAAKKVPGASSMFPNLIVQSSAATQALNSPTGQAALAIFDNAAHTGKRLRMTLTCANVKEQGFLPATKAPAVTTATKGAAPVAATSATTGVRLIVDRDEATGQIFIQTCIPLSAAALTSSWSVEDYTTHVKIANG